MFRKVSIVFLVLILLIATFSLNEFYSNLSSISTFKSYVVPERKLSEELVEQYLSGSLKQKEEAKELIISATLENLNYYRWSEYQNYIELQLYIADVLPEKGKELITVLNLSKDQAVVTIYRLIAEEYVFTHKIENLLPIDKIEFIYISDLNYNSMNLFQILDERLGAFTLEKFIESYAYIEQNWRSVWKKTVYSEEIFNQQWIEPQASSEQWVKIIESSTIQFIEQKLPEISVSTTRTKLTAHKQNFPGPEDFKVIHTIRTQEKYYWNTEYLRYILKEGTLKESDTAIAVLADIENRIESLLGFQSKAYKVSYPDGTTFIIEKDKVNPIKQ